MLKLLQFKELHELRDLFVTKQTVHGLSISPRLHFLGGMISIKFVPYLLSS